MSEGTKSTDAESADGEDAERAESVESKADESVESEGDERAESKADEGADSKGDEGVSVKEARLEIAGPDATAVDVRSAEEWGKGHIPGAIHLPDADPEKAARRLEKGARLLVIAEKGKHASRAATELAEKGYNAAAVKGGMKDWISEGYALQPTDDPDEDTELGAG